MVVGITLVRTGINANDELQVVRISDYLNVIDEMVCGAQFHIQLSSVRVLACVPEVFLFDSPGTLRFSEGGLHGGQ